MKVALCSYALTEFNRALMNVSEPAQAQLLRQGLLSLQNALGSGACVVAAAAGSCD
jgi:hypothetical protein